MELSTFVLSFSLTNQFFGALQRRVDLCRLFSTSLSKIRPAAAAAAHHAGKLLNDVAGVVLLGEFFAD